MSSPIQSFADFKNKCYALIKKNMTTPVFCLTVAFRANEATIFETSRIKTRHVDSWVIEHMFLLGCTCVSS